MTEIIPKTLGSRFAVPLAGVSVAMLPTLITLLAPFVWVSRKITRAIAPTRDLVPAVHRDELLAMSRLGAQSGQLEEQESRFVQNLIQLHLMKARDIMTPRPVIFALPESMPLKESVKIIEERSFSRIPLYGKNRDEITGFAIRGEILVAELKNPNTSTLADVKRPLAVTRDQMTVDVLFQRFISERHQIVLVVDEFGTPVGLVTFEDIIETIFGFEIMDEKDKVADLQSHARNLWRERARRMGIPLDEAEGDESKPPEV